MSNSVASLENRGFRNKWIVQGSWFASVPAQVLASSARRKELSTLTRQITGGPLGSGVVDEVHNLLAGTAHEQRASMNLLKFLSNQLKCAIVVLGTRDALAAMQTDAQIASRFPGFELPRWQENEDFRGFLAGIERQLPLRQSSRISASRAMVSAIMSATSGITGHISDLLSRAAEAAIRSKKECITPELLQSVIGTRTFA